MHDSGISSQILLRLQATQRCLTRAATVILTVAAFSVSQGADAADIPKPTTDFTVAEPFEALPGGATTVRARQTADAFSQPSANMDFEKQLWFRVGNGIFKKLWVSAPSTTRSSDGLGPLFNARSCQRCHLKDGRGHPPAANWPEDNAISILVRLSVPPRTDAERRLLTDHRANSIPEPVYGGQLQDFATQGQREEGHLHIDYQNVSVAMADGTKVGLRAPTYSIEKLNYGALHSDTMMSVRVAPPMIGLGLLEAIDEAHILALADADDRDGDGISGKPNFAWSASAGEVALGRFGWKAGQPTLRDQTAGAFNGDIGVGSQIVPSAWGDCTAAQTACRNAPHGNAGPGNSFEVVDDMFDLAVFYSRNLAVPARVDIDAPDVLAGKKLFYQTGCVACHTPKFVTKTDADNPEQSEQLIWPYTDMLLHDMGEGLADNRPESDADGREWRTPPLWGIGRTELVSGHTFFLHDGRARNFLEAILWHGGEAQAVRDEVVAMSAEDRERLLTFLNAL